MAVIQILALCLVGIYFSYRFKERLVDVMPVVISILILLLYGLGFVHHLSFLDVINCAVIAVMIFFLHRSKNKKEIGLFLKQELLHSGWLVAVFTVAVTAVCVSEKLVTWWDDYNFWATDVKALFYLDGFAGKYANVAAEFGDYPPGTQMMKWWFLHMSPDTFREGLMFAGYYTMNLVYLMPLMRRLRGKNVGVFLLMPVMLFLFPNVAEEFYLSGSCADLTIGVVYGAFLAGVLDEEGHHRLFYYGRLALYLMVMVLLKNVAFLWAGFGILFLWCYRLMTRKKEKDKAEGKGRKEFLAVMTVTLLPILTEGSWLLFCFRMRRVAKLTGTAVHMATKGVTLPDASARLIQTFGEAFLKWPLHRWKTIAIDWTPFTLFLFLCIMVAVLYKMGRIKRLEAWLCGIFFPVSGIVFYSINLISHLTIFAIEEQYLTPFGMVSSIERYGAPFMAGGLYLICFLYLNRAPEEQPGQKRYLPYLVCFGFVFLCADHKMAYEGLIGYRTGIEEVISGRQDILAGAAETFIGTLKASEEVRQIRDTHGMRVLYLRDGRNISWVQNTYVSFEVSPVSVMYGSFLPGQYTEEDAVKDILQSHAGYYYVDEAGEGGEAVFAPMVQEGEFCYNTLYKIENIDGQLFLAEVK